MKPLEFNTTLFLIGSWMIARLPDEVSKQLPSRGQVAVIATINDYEFRTVLEPDGNWGHWIHVDHTLQKKTGVKVDDTVSIHLEVTKEWPGPVIPDDFSEALKTAPDKVIAKWQDITPMARWEWVRWINATNSIDTRMIRIEKSISKLNGKHRRPCCFNLAACTVPEVSKNGILTVPNNR